MSLQSASLYLSDHVLPFHSKWRRSIWISIHCSFYFWLHEVLHKVYLLVNKHQTSRASTFIQLCNILGCSSGKYNKMGLHAVPKLHVATSKKVNSVPICAILYLQYTHTHTHTQLLRTMDRKTSHINVNTPTHTQLCNCSAISW